MNRDIQQLSPEESKLSLPGRIDHTLQSGLLTPTQIQKLDTEGYLKIERHFSTEKVEKILSKLEALWKEEGTAAGSDHSYREKGVRRLANLIAKGDEFREIVFDPCVLQSARAIFGPTKLPKLIMCNARDPGARTNERQIWHTDAGADIGEFGALTSILYLDHSTALNGATIVLPGSHKNRDYPPNNLTTPLPGEVSIEASPGDLVILNAHIWHAGGANSVDRHRRTVLTHYYREDVPFEPTVGVYLSEEQKKGFSPRELAMLHLKDSPIHY